MDPGQAHSALYGPLDTERSEIRLLNIHAGEFDGPITCSLAAASLEKAPCYNALSYAWGDPSRTAAISVNGIDIQVTENLVTIIRYLRSAYGEGNKLKLQPTPIWIDAICINQTDTAERTHQVLVMGNIYKQAALVLLWVGEPDRFSDLALDYINDPRIYRSFTGTLTGDLDSRSYTQEKGLLRAILEKNMELRRYWSRAWTLQEVVLAREDPIVLCGSRHVLFSNYEACARIVHDNFVLGPTALAAWAVADNVVPLHDDFKLKCKTTPVSISIRHSSRRNAYRDTGQQGLPLSHMLLASSTMVASDRRDYVYSIAGIIPKQDLERLHVDYSKTAIQVYRDAWTIILESPWLTADDIFGHLIPVLDSWSFPRPLPSWVPDFTGLAGNRSVSTTSFIDPGSPIWHSLSSARAQIQGDLLLLSGIVFDHVREISGPIHFNYGWGRNFATSQGSDPIDIDLDIEPLQTAERMATNGRETQISGSLEPFRALRDAEPVWKLMGDWQLLTEVRSIGGGDDSWLRDLDSNEEDLWEMLLGRQDIPAKWVEACPESMRNDTAQLKVAGLNTALHCIYQRIDEKRLILTTAGFFGVGTQHVEEGDAVVFVPGMKCIYTLRPFRDGYLMAGGFALISGLMDFARLDEYLEKSTLREEALKIY